MSFEAVCAGAERTMEELRVPGVALGVVADGEEHVAGLGVTSVENPLDVTPDTLFQIGSITKTFVAAAAMVLVERGQLDLDDPVRAHLPELRLADEQAAAGATMRHLLTHTGGWAGDYFDDLGAGEDALARMVERLPELEQQTPVGEVWAYNNAGFYLAGRVIEVLTGLPFERAMGDLVLQPLGLENSFFFPHDVMTRRFVVGHRDEDGDVVVAGPWWIGRAAHPAGGIVSTVHDVLRYARLALGAGAPLLRPDSWAELTRPHAVVGGDMDAVGLAWMLKDLDGVQLLAHGGGTNGQTCWLCVVPERGFAYACLTNHAYGTAVVDRAARHALEEFVGLRWPEPEVHDLDAARLGEYAGRYSAQMNDIELVAADGGLELRLIPRAGFPNPDSPPPPAPPPARLRFYADDWAIAPEEGIWKGTYLGFVRGPDGRITWARLGGRLYAPA